MRSRFRLLLAVLAFACVGWTLSARPALAELTPAAEQAQQTDPVGHWTGQVTWPDGRTENMIWEFRANGEMIASLGSDNTFTAHWTRDGGAIQIRFVYTTYFGRIGTGVIAGILMQDDAANPGRAFILRPAEAAAAK